MREVTKRSRASKVASQIEVLKVAFEKTYTLKDEIKSGQFGVVYEAHRKDTPDEIIAIKVMDRSDEVSALNEVLILKKLKDVLGVISFFDVKKDNSHIYMVGELANGGQLIQKKIYKEKDAHRLAKLFLEIIQGIHNHRVVHRNLKPENFLLSEEGSESSCLLCNFDYSKILPDDGMGLSTFCGTPEYMAPEVLDGQNYKEKVDTWSIGCILFLMLSGELPFGDSMEDGMDIVYERVAEADYSFGGASWGEVSKDAKDLISNLLKLNPSDRWTASQGLKCKWMMTGGKSRKPKVITPSERLEQMAKKISKTTKIAFNQTYVLGEVIREGSFGSTHKAHLKFKPDKFFNVKVMSRDDDEAALNEISLLLKLKDIPHVVQLVDCRLDNDNLYMVAANSKKDDVHNRLISKGTYSESDTRQVMKVLFGTVKLLHDQKVVHRNLKLDNLQLTDENDDISFVVCNFDRAKVIPEDGDGLSTFCGTPAYMAPEIVDGVPYHEPVDMWSIGCMMYLLLSGDMPFGDEEDGINQVYENILLAVHHFDGKIWGSVSTDAKFLIDELLQGDPKKRCTAASCVKSSWFSEGSIVDKAEKVTNDSSINKRSKRSLMKRKPSTEKIESLLSGMSKNIYELFSETYVLGEEIAAGTFGTVYKTHPMSNPKETLAVKVMDRSDEETALIELAILVQLKEVANVTKIIDCKMDTENIFLIETLIRVENVGMRIYSKGKYTEIDARRLVKKLLETVKSIHLYKVVHRNLKSENLTLKDMDDDTSFVLCNFDRAKVVPDNSDGLTTFCGTPSYMAPEILEGIGYCESVDMWSVGCIMYLLLSGELPFGDEEEDGLNSIFDRVGLVDYSFKSNVWGFISEEAKELIRQFFVSNPKKRSTASAALGSPWFTKSLEKIVPERIVGFQDNLANTGSDSILGPKMSSLTQPRRGSWKSSTTKEIQNFMCEISKNPKNTFDEIYILDEIIKEGSFGSLYKAHHKSNPNNFFSVKVMDKSDDEAARDETSILLDLKDVPNVINLVDLKMDDNKIYMVSDIAQGGDVAKQISKLGTYSEGNAKCLVKTLLETMTHMHRYKVVHRNLKPSNLFLKNKNDAITFVICNFDRAKVLPDNSSSEGLSTFCGTPPYMAAEIIEGKTYREKVDMWSIGCIIFLLLGGELPFGDEEEDGISVLYERIAEADYNFSGDRWDTISEDAKNFIKNLLDVDPSKRWSATQSLKCDWMDESKSSKNSPVTKTKKNVSNKKEKGPEKMSSKNGNAKPKTKYAMMEASIKEISKSVTESTDQDFKSEYVLGEEIKHGSFGSIYLCHHKARPKKKLTVKVIDRFSQDTALNEIKVIRTLQDIPRIVRLVDLKIDQEKIYVVVNQTKGDICDRIKRKGTYAESDARCFAKLLLGTIQDVHRHKIVHRNLKPENFMLVDDNDDVTFTLFNFDYARVLPTDENDGSTTFCGTPAYMAPEMIEGELYREKVDMWSAGCIIFQILSGDLPFGDQDDGIGVLYERIIKADFDFDDLSWNAISQEAKMFISSLLEVDQKKRSIASQGLQSDWILEKTAIIKEAKSNAQEISPKFGNKKDGLKQSQSKKTSTLGGRSKNEKKTENPGTKSSAITVDQRNHDNKISSINLPDYVIGNKIMNGSFVNTFRAYHISKPKRIVCIKVIDRSNEKKGNIELSILKTLKNIPFVVQLVDLKKDDNNLFLVQTFAKGPTIYRRLRRKGTYDEGDAKRLAFNLLEAIQAVHAHNIVYRDLKTENLLLKSTKNDTSFVLSNFESAKTLPASGGLSTFCGTPAYTAPEVLTGNEYYEKVDMWSIGCILFLVIGGDLPFGDPYEDGLNEVYERIAESDYCFGEYWDEVSKYAKKLVSNLLRTKSKRRWSAEDALKSEWFEGMESVKEEDEEDYEEEDIELAETSKVSDLNNETRNDKEANKLSNTNIEVNKIPQKDNVAVVPKPKAKARKKEKISHVPFDKTYVLGENMKEDSFGVICKTHHKLNPNEKYSVKVVDRFKEETALNERSVLRTLKDIPGIIPLIDFTMDSEKIYLVQGLVHGGDIHDCLEEKKKYSEYDAHRLAKLLLDTVQQMHSRKVVHRNLKPENLMCKEKDDFITFVICNFDRAKVMSDDGVGLTTFCGTPAYMAPEVLEGVSYREKVDMWSVGCILFELLCGELPFGDQDDNGIPVLYERIIDADYNFEDGAWSSVSEAAKSLIKSLLKVNSIKRWSADQGLTCDWIMNEVEITESDEVKHQAEIKPLAIKIANASTNKPFKELYKLGAKIGKELLGALHKATHTAFPDETLAVKIVDKSDIEGARNETTILRSLLEVPNVTQLVDFKIENDKAYVVQVMPCAESLYDRFKRKGTYPESDVKCVARDLIEIFRSLHSQQVVHRDLKAENLKLIHKNNDVSVVLCNFDYAKTLHVDGSGLLTKCGTPAIMAPEILQGSSYFEEVDMWSVGCLLFLLLGGDLPFGKGDSDSSKKAIMKASYSLQGKTWDAVSFDAKKLITNLLKIDPKERWSAIEASQCSWINGVNIESMINEISKYPKIAFDEIYVLDEVLKEGSFGTLYSGHHKSYPEESLAIKMTDDYNADAALNETSLLRQLQDVPSVVELVDFKQDKGATYIIHSMATGGSVYDRLNKKKMYTENDTCHLAKLLLQTIRRVHRHKVVHRNLKTENLMLKDKNDDVSFVLGNFEYAKMLPDCGLTTFCGTPNNMAPEIIEGAAYREKIDLWSIGCILFYLLSGEFPFGDEDLDGLSTVYNRINEADYSFDDECWNDVSKNAKTLIKKLLKVNPADRWSSEKGLRCKWILECDDIASSNGMQPDKASMNKTEAKIDINRKGKTKRNESAMHDPAQERRDIEIVSKAIKKSSNKSFKDSYTIGEEIFSKSNSSSFKTFHNGYKKATLAVKRIDKDNEEDALKETEILRALTGIANVTQLLDFKDDEEYFYLIESHFKGGDVLDRLNRQGPYTESEARLLFRGLLDAIGEVHRRKVVHRNLKPDNLLLKQKQNDTEVVLCNFEFAKILPNDFGGLSTFCGTPAYTAPEIVDSMKYREKVDMWSIGCIMFLLITGDLPFGDENEFGHRALFERISSGEYGFKDESSVSKEAKEFIANLLSVEPTERWSASQALRCKWMKVDGKMSKSKVPILKGRIQLKKRDKKAPSAVTRHAPAFIDTKLSSSVIPKEIKQRIGVTRQLTQNVGRKKSRDLEATKNKISLFADKSFNQVYSIGRKIQKGSFWDVHRVTCNKYPELLLTVKIVDKNEEKLAFHEINILRKMNNIQNVVSLIDSKVETEKIYLIRAASKNGLFFDKFAGRRTFTEDDTRGVAKVLLRTVNEMHQRGVVHRNLKPENIIFEYDRVEPSIILCNFENSAVLPDDDSGFSTFCGSPAYTAPEVLNGIPYREKIDLWSVGCILFLMLGGNLPFGNEYYGQPIEEQQILYERISNGDYNFNGDVWYNVSGAAKGLIINLLKVNPRNRWKACEAMQYQWFSKLAAKKPLLKSGSMANIHNVKKTKNSAGKPRKSILAKVANFEKKSTKNDVNLYTLRQIQKKEIPGLNYNTPEKYLRDKDFQEIFNATRAEVENMKGWKLTQLRRQYKLV